LFAYFHHFVVPIGNTALFISPPHKGLASIHTIGGFPSRFYFLLLVKSGTSFGLAIAIIENSQFEWVFPE
jgi:hypothetical protein